MLYRFLFAIGLLLPGITDLNAQFRFTALQGLPTAQSSARETLGEDASVVLIGAPGAFEFQSFNFSFDIDTGRSNAWGYVFHSKSSGELATYIVIRFLAYQAFELSTLPFPIPGNLTTELDTSGTYADSDNMAERLKTDTAFQNYQTDLPESLPQFVTFSQVIDPDSLQLPNGFPIDQETWTISFTGGGDSTMTCFVASGTGEVFCRRIYGPPTSSPRTEEGVVASLRVAPNPARDHVLISLQGYSPAQLSSSRLVLINSIGQVVADLTESFRGNGNRQAELSVEGLPAGHYRSLLTGENFSEQIGVIVVQ